jgi:AcrR family transcriptional regulator
MSSRSPTRRRRRTAEEARQQILDAAERRLIAGGPEAIRLQDVAADVGLSHPAILHHFGSREGLIEALVAHGMRGFQAQILAGWPSELVPDVAGAFERFYSMAEARGYARLLAWLILSGRGSKGLRAGLLRPLVERMHAGRVRANQRAGQPAGDFEDTVFMAVLFATTVFGDALFGPLTRRSMGLRGAAADARRFRRWLIDLVLGRAGGAPLGGSRVARTRARRAASRRRPS